MKNETTTTEQDEPTIETTPFTAAVNEKAAFVITDRAGVEWYLRKLREKQSEIDTIKAQAAAMVKAIENDMNGLKYCYEAQVEEWTRQQLSEQGGKAKSVKTFQGTVGFRTTPAGINLVNPLQALLHAKQHASDFPYVPFREEIDTQIYVETARRKLEETGELLPGLAHTPACEKFSVRFPKKGEADSE